MDISKNEIKFVRSLAQKKFRDESGLFVVEGEKSVQEALDSCFNVEKVYYTAEIGEEAMSRMTLLSSPSPALALVHKRTETSDFQLPEKDLVLALDSVRDPGNLGTIVRLADWFGVRTIIASKDTVDLYNPKVVQATMGSIFRIEVHYCDLAEVLAAQKAGGRAIYGTFLEGENIYAAAKDQNGIIVMGSESNGISQEVGASVTRKITIPPFSGAGRGPESLNVAIATAITCSEFRRNL